MKKFHAITEDSIIKCKAVGINADQLDELVESSTLECNEVADLLHQSHNMVSQNAATTKMRVPSLQLEIVSRALEFYRCNGGLDADTQFDCHSLKELFSGNHIVNVDVDDNKYRDQAHVDLPIYQVDSKCPDCDHQLRYLTNQKVIECGHCGFEAAPCDFIDVQIDCTPSDLI